MIATLPRIRFDQTTKHFPGVLALDAVSFDVKPGCVHAIVGENGAGKSTLMKILSGAVCSDAGSIILDGQLTRIRDARHAQELGIAAVHQELNLAGDLSVSENVFLGLWPRSRVTRLIKFKDLHSKVQALFDDFGLSVPIRATASSLSVAQQQMVEIAKALSLKARVLILDEPSAVLTPHELEGLFALIRRLTASGVSVLYISHRLDEIFELADYVTVLRDGHHISTRPIGDVNRESLIAETVGRSLDEEFPKRSYRRENIVLSVRNLCAGRVVRDVSFEIRAGEVFALTGLVGAGRSTVAKAIFGAVHVDKGSVQVGETQGPFVSPQAAKLAGVAFLPEDRKREGLLLDRPLRENLTLAHYRDHSRIGFIDAAQERQTASTLLQEFGIRSAGSEVRMGTLSGGNQQKTLLARWLQRPYPLVILDEPTRGVDVGAKVEIYQRLNAIATKGMAVLLISSELPEVIGMADRIGVMCEGRLRGVLDNTQRNVSQEAIMRLAVGDR